MASLCIFCKHTKKYLKSEQQTAKMYKDYFNDRFENEVKFQEKMKIICFIFIKIKRDASDEIVKGLVFLNRC